MTLFLGSLNALTWVETGGAFHLVSGRKGSMDLRVTDLPEEITSFFSAIPNWREAISGEVALVLLRLWQKKPLEQEQENLEIASSEVAAIWSLNSERPIETMYVAQVKRLGHITPTRQIGSGKRKTDLYRLGDIKDRRVRRKEEKHEHVTERQLYRRGRYSRKQRPTETNPAEEAA